MTVFFYFGTFRESLIKVTIMQNDVREIRFDIISGADGIDAGGNDIFWSLFDESKKNMLLMVKFQI